MRVPPLLGALTAVVLTGGIGLATAGAATGDSAKVFVPSATVNADHTVTLPLHRGRSGDQTVWFVVTEASDSAHAATWRASVSQKLRNALGTDAVQKVTVDRDGTVVFPATVDFGPQHVVAPGPSGFPPAAAAPGAVGEPGYSPLVELPDGAVLNAPQLANSTGRADKVTVLDVAGRTVRYELTDGFARGNAVVYASTDSSDAGAAAIEDVTFAPALNAAPFADGDGTDSARASLAAFTNGRTGVGDPDRQGLNSALLGEGSPLNVLAWTPNQGRYSPLWDVHLTTWAPGQTPTLQTEFTRIADLAKAGLVTAFPSGPWGASGFIVNCPIIAQH
ncbi:DUF7482 domain-containing protein [Terrabacter terrigena]|uniref:Uncharacterized protein n=1 Tax=Terrabacter terrigena TaxID=574718 RepID=A0ABW3MRX2_9MICO